MITLDRTEAVEGVEVAGAMARVSCAQQAPELQGQQHMHPNLLPCTWVAWSHAASQLVGWRLQQQFTAVTAQALAATAAAAWRAAQGVFAHMACVALGCCMLQEETAWTPHWWPC